jgi:hypothetical protein
MCLFQNSEKQKNTFPLVRDENDPAKTPVPTNGLTGSNSLKFTGHDNIGSVFTIGFADQ